MQETKLIRLLSFLEPSEYKSLLLFAKSPYLNNNKQATALLKCLHPYHPEFDHPKLTKGYIFKKMHTNGRLYHEGRLNLIMSQSVKLYKQFLAFEQLKKDEFNLNKLQLNAYREKRMDAEFTKASQKQGEALETWRKDGEYHLERFLLNKEVFSHPATPRYQVGMPSLDNSLEALDMFFVWEKLKNSSYVLNRMRLLKETHELKLFKKIFKEFEEIINNTPTLNFYKNIITIQLADNDELLCKLIESFEEILYILEKTEQEIFLVLLLNLASQKYRAGKAFFKLGILDLYRIGLDNNLIGNEKHISDITFTNIASIGSINFKFDWTRSFIRKYRAKLKDNIQNNAINLSMGYFYFYQAKYSGNIELILKTIDSLKDIDYSKKNYSYRTRALLLKSYYEYFLKKEKNIDFIYDYCNAFEQYLKRDKLIGKKKSMAFLNYIAKVRVLSKYYFNLNDSKKEILREKKLISENDNIFSKNWLVEKIEELLGY